MLKVWAVNQANLAARDHPLPRSDNTIATTTTAATTTTSMGSLVLLGDSLFQRAYSQDKDDTGQVIGSLGPRLSDAYARRLDVVNRGFSGYNTRQILSVLNDRSDLLPTNMRIVVIFLGANDARLPNTPGGPQQHVPLEEFRKNIDKIVDSVRWWSPRRRVILITPPPVDERKTVAADSAKDASLKGVVRRKAIITAAYARLAKEVGSQSNNVAVLDLWGIMMEKAGWNAGNTKWSATAADDSDAEYLDEQGKVVSDRPVVMTSSDEYTLPGASAAPENKILQSYLHDGLHLTRKGYDLLFEELMSLIAEKFLDQMPKHLPFVVPAWDDAGDGKQRKPKSKKELEEQFDKFVAGLVAGALIMSWVFYMLGLW